MTWSEKTLVQALRSRYPENEWGLLTQVRDGAGFARRTFDALAIGYWGSRGHAVHGFECKVSKADWTRELKQPEKADSLIAFCDFWWVVTPKGVVDPFTLPLGWGLLEALDNGTIRTVVQADKLEPKPLTKGFVAQIIKRTLAADPDVTAVAEADADGYQRGIEYGQHRLEAALKQTAEATRVVNTLSEVTGLPLSTYTQQESLRAYGEIIRKVVANEGWDSPRHALKQARAAAQRFIEKTDVYMEVK